MFKKFFSFILFVLLVSSPFAVCFGQYSAQNKNTSSVFKLNPKVYEKKLIEPGTVLPISFSLLNQVNQTFEITVRIEDFYPNPANKANTTRIKDWSNLAPEKFILLPLQKKIISGTITIPEDLPSDSYYGKVVFLPTLNQNPIASIHNVYSIIALSIAKPDELVESILLQSFIAMPPEVEYGPVIFETTLTNHGNLNLYPNGSIIIRNYEAKEISRIPFQSYDKRTLFPPKSTVTFKTIWDEFLLKTPESLLGKWNFLQQFAFDWEYWDKFQIGTYYAELEIFYGDKKPKRIYGFTDFFVFPWRFIIYVLGFSALLLVFLDETWRWYKKNLRKQIIKDFRKNPKKTS